MWRTLVLAVAVTWAIPLNAAQTIVRQVSDVSFGVRPGGLPIFEAPTIYRDELYFSASTNEDEQTRLFKTNGRQVSSFDVSPGYGVGTQTIEFQGQLYFRGDDGNGIEPFRTDGRTLTNLNLSEAPQGSWPYNFSVVGDNLYFQGGLVDSSGQWQSYMFHSDGIEVTPLANPDVESNSSWGSSVGGKFYFPANGPDGFELYRADGRNIRQIIDVNPGPGGSSPWSAGELNGEFYFTAMGPAGRGLYRTHGEGAIQLPFPPDPTQYGGPVNFVNFGNALYFQGHGEDGYELYRTDGTSVTHLDLFPGPESSGAASYASEQLGDKLIVPGRGPNGGAVFVINRDGELLNHFDLGLAPFSYPPPQNHIERALQDRARGFYDLPPQWLHEFRGEVYFHGTGADGPDLYKTDGQTLTKFDLVPESGDLYRFAAAMYDAESLGDSLYFGASTSKGFELVKTDGVTTSIFDLAPGFESSHARQLELVGDELVFETHFSSSTVIYATDGTSVRRLAEFPDLELDTGYGYREVVRSVTDFMRFRDELIFLARTEQGWRLHRVAAVPEPLAIAMAALAFAGFAAMRRNRQVR